MRSPRGKLISSRKSGLFQCGRRTPVFPRPPRIRMAVGLQTAYWRRLRRRAKPSATTPTPNRAIEAGSGAITAPLDASGAVP